MPDQEMDKTPKTPGGESAPQSPKPSAPVNVPGTKPNPIPAHERTSQVPISDKTQQVTPIDPKTGKPLGQPAAPSTAGIVKPTAAGSAFTAPTPQPVKPADPAQPPASGQPSQAAPAKPAAPAQNVTPAAPAVPTAPTTPTAPTAPSQTAPKSAALDADKTVILQRPSSASPATPAPSEPKPTSTAPAQSVMPPSAPSQPPQAAAQASDKTVVLTKPAAPSVQAPPSAPAISAPAAQAKPAPSPMAPPPPPLSLGIDVPGEIDLAPSNKGRILKIISISAASVIFLIAGAWLVVPKILKISADKLAKQGRHVDASKKLQLAVSFFPLDRMNLLTQLGRELRLSKQYPGAQQALDQVIKNDPHNFVALREMGMVLSESDQKPAAITTFQKYLELRPDDSEVVKWVGEIAYDEKNFPVASSAFEQFVKIGQPSAADWKKLGIAYYEQKIYDKSAGSLKTALEKDKNTKDAHGLLGAIYSTQGHFAEAIGEFRSEIALSPDREDLKDGYAEAVQKLADLNLSERKYNEAVSTLEDGLTVSTKNDAAFHYQLANLFAIRKKRSSAFSHLAQAVKEDAALKGRAKKDRAFAQYWKVPAFQKIVK